MPAATAASSKQAVDPLLDNTDLLGLATSELFSQLHDELNMACGGSGQRGTGHATEYKREYNALVAQPESEPGSAQGLV